MVKPSFKKNDVMSRKVLAYSFISCMPFSRLHKVKMYPQNFIVCCPGTPIRRAAACDSDQQSADKLKISF